MGLFQEYLDSKGNVAKAKVDATGDRVDPMKAPNAPKGGSPYKCSDGKLKKAKEKGFGDEGDSKLKYNPKVDTSKGVAPAKIPTAEQAELCGVLIDAIKKDHTLAEQLVFQLKRSGLLGMVVAEMLQCRETFQHMSEVMGHKSYGPSVCSRLVRAMGEEVAPPFADTLQGEEDEDEEDLEEDPDAEGGVDDMGDVAEEQPQGAPPVDPAMAGMDPAMQGMPAPGAMPGMPPAPPMPGAAPPAMPGMPPMPPMPQMGGVPPMASAMKNFQRAMMSRR